MIMSYFDGLSSVMGAVAPSMRCINEERAGFFVSSGKSAVQSSMVFTEPPLSNWQVGERLLSKRKMGSETKDICVSPELVGM